jgi:hypothetical protein
MTSAATASPVKVPGIVDTQRPVVILDGVPNPGLLVRKLAVRGPLDERELLIETCGHALSWSRLRQIGRQQAVVAMPLRLQDGSMRWPVLGMGALAAIDQEHDPNRRVLQWRLHDAWTARLSHPLRLSREEAARIIHGDAWDLRSLLELLATAAGLKVSLRLVPHDIAREPVARRVDPDQPLGLILSHLLAEHGLLLQREAHREDGRVYERAWIESVGRGRTIELAWPDAMRSPSPVLRITSRGEPPASRAWEAVAGPWRIESTFTLHPGWDPGLADAALPDAAFSRADNPQFAAYANVYRLWVLNEDGWFARPPYARPTFDLAAFFDDPTIRPQPRALGDCLTLDDAGRPHQPIVQMRLDPGGAWSTYPGAARALDVRAGVYLDDAVLPAGFLAAARAGTVELRVTATLSGPHPVRLIRWQGNPFAGSRPPRRLHAADRFRFARVHEQSIHAQAVREGAATAREADDHDAMTAWLTRQMRHSRLRVDDRAGRASLHLHEAMPLLRIGDVIRRAGGPGVDPHGRPEDGDGRGAVVRRFTCRWPSGHDPRPRSNDIATELELEF